MRRGPGVRGSAFRFKEKEIADMERTLDITDGATPSRRIIQSLANSFSESPERVGHKEIQWKQVWNWFQNRRHAQKQKIARMPASIETPKKQGRKSLEGQQLKYEAKSTDGAWYDVSTFISHKCVDSNDPQVLVRYSGFGPEDDEWVSLRSIRQRSQACEASHCVIVLPGDLILCFQDTNEQALYFDAEILDVQRRRHDVRGCRCRFWVRYKHDESEEVVPLRKVCRRPERDHRLQYVDRGPPFLEDTSNKNLSTITRVGNSDPIASTMTLVEDCSV